MKQRTTGRVAWIAFGFITALFVAGFGLSFLNRAALGGGPSTVANNLFLVAMFSFPVVGVFIASRQPRNTIAWILLAIGLAWGLNAFLSNYAYYGLVADPGSVPGPDMAAAVDLPVWVPGIGLAGTFLILLFPDGRLPSPRWKPLGWLSAAALTLSYLVILLTPEPLEVEGLPAIPNPLGIEALWPILQPMVFVIMLIPMCIVACAVSLVQRFRRSGGVERLQLKFLTAAVAAVAVIYIIVFTISASTGWEGSTSPLWVEVVQWMAVSSFALIPIAAGFAVLRYRLYDIDVVISKTLVFGGLAVFITVVYVAIVVGIGSLVGAGGEPNLGLSIVATAVVAVAFQPVREWLTRVANRLVYGVRATPYQVLSAFSTQLGHAAADEDTLGRMARLLAEGTGAARAQVWLKLGERMRAAASWPQEVGSAAGEVANPDGVLPAFPQADRAVPVSHQGELLGALTITKPRGEPVSPTEDKLVEDLAGQAGLVVRNTRLTEQLKLKLEQLRDSRRRLVEAQDQERRRLERDLHDGAQQQLVALKIKLGVARTLAQREGAAKTGQLVEQLSADTDEAVATLRALAHGIYPPLLAAEGLPPALIAATRKSPLPVEVEADEDLGRFPQEVEAAVYFCVLEALQNATKYAHPTHVTIRLHHSEGQLAFAVSDDGAGFDPATTPHGHGLTNMVDRLDALGGHLDIHSTPGAGTTITGRLPTPAPAAQHNTP